LENVDHLRLVTKVARLYYTHGLRQTDIAERLQISQSRVSRLLSQAEEANIVRIVSPFRCADVAPTTAVAVRGTHSFTRSGVAAVRPG
jgi:DNA-binding transcriptional regulator LsrR (DeoR family)